MTRGSSGAREPRGARGSGSSPRGLRGGELSTKVAPHFHVWLHRGKREAMQGPQALVNSIREFAVGTPIASISYRHDPLAYHAAVQRYMPKYPNHKGL